MFSRMLDTLQAEMTRQRVQAQRLRGKAKELDERCGTVQRETSRLAGQLRAVQQPSQLPPLAGGGLDATLPPLGGDAKPPLPAPTSPPDPVDADGGGDAVVPLRGDDDDLGEKRAILRKAVEAGALSPELYERAVAELGE